MRCPIPRSRSAVRRRPAFRPAAVLSPLLALALALAAITPALGIGEIIRLREPVTDLVDALSEEEERRIGEALAQLRRDRGVQLFVAFIDSTEVEDAPGYAEAAAHENSLGGNDALLLVAVEDRSDALWVGPELDQVSETDIDRILTWTVEPRLSEGDFGGAVIAGADVLGRAAAGEPIPDGPGQPAQPGQPGVPALPGVPGGFDLTPVLALLLVAGGLLLVGRSVWARRTAARSTAASLAALNRDANRALLAADEALKDAGNDVEFAAAQWGDAEVVPYREAITRATAELRAAFGIRQRLDDAEPETPAQREQLLREILARTRTAQELLDVQEQRFDQLRDLQAAAPAQLAALPAAIEALRDRHRTALATEARLQAAYAPAAVASIEGNLAEATKALDTAAAEAGRGRDAVEARPPEGVLALRRAQEAVATATTLVEAVEHLASALDEAAARLPRELEAAAADVALAREAVGRLGEVPPAPPAPPTGPSGRAGQGGAGASPPFRPGDAAGALGAAEQALEAARSAASSRPPDPLEGLRRALEANEAADAIVAGVRASEEQWRRRLEAASAAVSAAEGHVTRATDYVTTRRHGVGRTARTRVAEAERSLEEARRLAERQPEQSVAAAGRATRLADEAYRLAAGEFDAWTGRRGPVAGPYRGGASPEAEVIGAVLGGILGGMLSGGGRARGSGWGGSSWGGPLGGGSRGGGGFGLPPGPFGGGGGGRMGGGGRVGGGGFGSPGGGGRVRGGRW